jgi:hypothetical protein
MAAHPPTCRNSVPGTGGLNPQESGAPWVTEPGARERRRFRYHPPPTPTAGLMGRCVETLVSMGQGRSTNVPPSSVRGNVRESVRTPP